MNWLIVAIVLLLAHKEYLASPTPLKLPGLTQRLTPYIKHWEAANYDRVHLHEAHQKHIEQKRHRRKRELQGGRSGGGAAVEYGPAHTIRLNFFAHDREFRLVLRQDPLSVFAGDVEIENTLGPMDYDISRIYTGSLEDDENSHVHAILTSDNLLDGTIETNSEDYYLEPVHRYSHDLPKTGVHSIVYKVSDVNMHKSGGGVGGGVSGADNDASQPTNGIARGDFAATSSQAAVHCASERLRRSMLLDDLKRRKTTGNELRGRGKSKSYSATDIMQQSPDESSAANTANAHKRRKRWLPEELSASSSSNDHQNPPLPLDLDVPYNDDFSIFKNLDTQEEHEEERTRSSFERTTKNIQQGDRERILQKGSVITWRNAAGGGGGVSLSNGSGAGFTPSLAGTTTTKSSRNRNIIVNNYNPGNSATGGTTSFGGGADNNYNHGGGGVRKTYTKHKNIIVSTYNNRSTSSSNNNNYNIPYDPADNSNNGIYNNDNNNFINNFFNTNWTTMFNANDRPSHKTHVEIITKNGATKKPNIIVNNYNPPDITLTPTNNNNQYPNFNSMLMTNVLSGRGGSDGSGDGNGMHGGSSSARALYDRKITCMLYLQADHTFFQKMGSDEASIEAITRHVQRANTIYKNTDFNNDGKPDNITFMIKRIKVHNMNALKDPTYRFPGNYGVEKFLELFSEEDYDAFCLAYMFTYRDFEMGTLGLAWTGDLKNAGGVCEKNGHYRGSLKSLNTGIVTLLNYGKHVPPAVSHVTLAHEIGHNFGSPHDPEQCTPGGEDGNFIMFARATSGDKKNNNKFSPCSLKSIEPVLNAKARSIKGCFTEPQTSICGNGVVEPGEQCDCGWEEDCKDSCCFPMSRHPRIDEKPCTLTPRAMCSPSQGPCCTTDCKVKFGDKCRDDNGCRDPSFCDGRMPQCPPSVNKPNKTICNKEFVCYMGDCTGSICLAYGLESCQCIPGPKDDKIKSCELCCKLPGEDNPCRSSFEWNEPPFDVPDMYAKPGTPCNDYNGYCDVFQKCREVDPSGPLATLRKLLLSEESIASFKKWIQHNWYTVALAALGVFVLLILSTKLLAKRSNLKLKSVTIIHSATTETVRLPDDNNGVIVHTAVRTKVPFKKKVRGERSTANKLSKNNNNSSSGNQKSNNASKTAAQAANRVKLATATAAEQQSVKKPTRTKKNRVAAPPPTQNTTTAGTPPTDANSDPKKLKKFKKKHSKEIIDYSARDAANATATAATGGTTAHTNTFGKVQRWLLESPIVAQPLSHIEHSSKIRKVMSKSQSTPERLVQQTPQKTKSVGNLANDKVKLQVVYKPPFKFSLRLSKNAKVKTHVIGGAGGGGGINGAVNKMKRKSRTAPGNESKRATQVAAPPMAADGSASKNSATKRTALLLRSASKNGDEDNQILTLNEPNYETLNPKTLPSKMENPFYENMQYTQLRDEGARTASASAADGVQKISRSSSKTNLDAAANRHSYSRSNSLTAQNPFAAIGSGNRASPRKLSDSNSINLSRNFGSTQNLINASQSSTNLAKSKKRSSLNLKTSLSSAVTNKNGKDPPKRSNSNMNLRRDGSATQLPSSPSPAVDAPPVLRRSASNTAAQQQKLPAAATSMQAASAAQQQQPQQKLPTYAAQRASRASINNIPRASLNTAIPTVAATSNSSYASSSGSSHSNNSAANNLTPAATHSSSTGSSKNSNFNFKRHSPPATVTTVANSPPAPVPPPTVSSNNSSHAEHRRSRSNMPSVSLQQQQQQQQSKQRSNSIRQHQHNHHPPPLPATAAAAPADDELERELPSDLEVMVSDVENLVS